PPRTPTAFTRRPEAQRSSSSMGRRRWSAASTAKPAIRAWRSMPSTANTARRATRRAAAATTNRPWYCSPERSPSRPRPQPCPLPTLGLPLSLHSVRHVAQVAGGTPALGAPVEGHVFGLVLQVATALVNEHRRVP